MTDIQAMEPQYRTFTPDIEIRSRGDGRTICGIAVPYDAPQMIDDLLIEEFARGTFNHQISQIRAVANGRRGMGIRFSNEHVKLGGKLVGAVTELRDDAAGAYVEMRCSKTRDGDEALELIKDGALNQLSVGFVPISNQRMGFRGNAEHVRRVKADMTEVAVVMSGAYGREAEISAVRSQRWVDPNYLQLREKAEKYMDIADLRDWDLELRRTRLGY